jgi:hypothetical protein
MSDIAALIRAGAESGDPAADLESLIALAGISGNEAAVRAAGALRMWLDGNQSLEGCLGKAAGWRSGRRRALRDEMLGALAAKWFPGLRGSPLAKQILAAAACARRARCRPDGMLGEVHDVIRLENFPDFEFLRKFFK